MLGLAAGGGGLIDGEGLVEGVVELDLGHLDVDGEVDEDGAGAAGAHDVEGLLEDLRDEGGLAGADGPLGDALADGLDVDGLEVLLVHLGAGGLAGDAEDGDAVGHGGVEAGDHVGSGGSGGADADSDVAGLGAGVAVGHVGGALDVAGEDVADGAAGLEGGVEGVDGGAGDSEGDGDALVLEDADCGFDRLHLGHGRSPLFRWCEGARRAEASPAFVETFPYGGMEHDLPNLVIVIWCLGN